MTIDAGAQGREERDRRRARRSRRAAGTTRCCRAGSGSTTLRFNKKIRVLYVTPHGDADGEGRSASTTRSTGSSPSTAPSCSERPSDVSPETTIYELHGKGTREMQFSVNAAGKIIQIATGLRPEVDFCRRAPAGRDARRAAHCARRGTRRSTTRPCRRSLGVRSPTARRSQPRREARGGPRRPVGRLAACAVVARWRRAARRGTKEIRVRGSCTAVAMVDRADVAASPKPGPRARAARHVRRPARRRRRSGVLAPRRLARRRVRWPGLGPARSCRRRRARRAAVRAARRAAACTRSCSCSTWRLSCCSERRRCPRTVRAARPSAIQPQMPEPATPYWSRSSTREAPPRSRIRQRPRWSMPVTRVPGEVASGVNSTTSIRPPTSAEPTRSSIR